SLAARRLQGVELEVERLLVGGDPGIADQHAASPFSFLETHPSRTIPRNPFREDFSRIETPGFGVAVAASPRASRRPSFTRGFTKQKSAESSLFFSPLLSEAQQEQYRQIGLYTTRTKKRGATRPSLPRPVSTQRHGPRRRRQGCLGSRQLRGLLQPEWSPQGRPSPPLCQPSLRPILAETR